MIEVTHLYIMYVDRFAILGVVDTTHFLFLFFRLFFSSQNEKCNLKIMDVFTSRKLLDTQLVI